MVLGGTAVHVGVLVATVAGLWIGARLLVDSVIRLARRIGLSELTIGLTIVAVGTSTPELVVTADAAVAGLGAIAVGNVVGSNVFNMLGVLGLGAVVHRWRMFSLRARTAEACRRPHTYPSRACSLGDDRGTPRERRRRGR